MLTAKDTEENKTRLENVRELKSSILSYLENTDNPSLAGFLEEIALYTDLEQYNDSDDAVVMMTMHSAKGLEFPNVFLVGFEDGLFPGMRAIGDAEEMEEERRLCYVAITRAKQNLTISYARQRMLYGRTNAARPSQFLKEIPEACMVKKGGYRYPGGKRRWSYGPWPELPAPCPQAHSPGTKSHDIGSFPPGSGAECRGHDLPRCLWPGDGADGHENGRRCPSGNCL